MKCSFSIENNDIESGGGMTLCIENIDKPSSVIGKKCVIKLFEIDNLIGKRKETTQDDLLAEFETQIIESYRKGFYVFDNANTIRTDKFENKLPVQEILKDPLGNPLPIPLKFTPPHFTFYFDQGSPHPTGGHTVLIQSEADELEMYIYEIGFTVEIEGELIYDARKTASYVNCVKVLAENCRNAAEFYKDCHNEMINVRGVGTHYGNKYIYEVYTNEYDFLKDVSIEEFGRVDSTWITANTGLYWDDVEKNRFITQKSTSLLEKTSCIDYVRDSLKLGFSKTGMQAEWKAIWNKVKNGRGDLLAKALIANGWIALYYNPDVIHPYDDGLPGSDDYKAATEHTYSYKKAKADKTYYDIPLTDLITDYHPSTISSSGALRTVASFNREPHVATTAKRPPDKFFKIPIGLILARGGTHTALFSLGKVLEVHWDVGPFLPSGHPLFQKSDFITDWPWNSGVIVAPKIYWE